MEKTIDEQLILRPVALPQQDEQAVPERIEAGGRVWDASVDDQPFGAWLGWQVAVELGRPVLDDAETEAPQ